MKNWREGYIKVAKGGNRNFVWGMSLAEIWNFADNKPVFVFKNGGKKK